MPEKPEAAMSAPRFGPAETAELRAIVKRATADYEAHAMGCAPCRTPGMVCGTGDNIKGTLKDAKRSLGITE